MDNKIKNVMQMKQTKIRNWDDIHKEINGYLTFNPEGSLADFFEMYPKNMRDRYYKYRPFEWKWPNQRRYKKIEPEDAKKHTPSRLKHVVFFKRNFKCNTIDLYYHMDKLGIDKNVPPSDWSQNRDFYKEMMEESMNEKKQTAKEKVEVQENIKDKEIKIKTPKRSTPVIKNPVKKEIATNKKENTKEIDSSFKEEKIKGLMEIARMINEL